MSREFVFAQHLCPHTFVSIPHRFVYVAVPKAACTTLKWWFSDLMGVSARVRQFPFSTESLPELTVHDSLPATCPELTGLHHASLHAAWTGHGYLRFAFVRNPYRRLFSAWQSKWLQHEWLQCAPYATAPFLHAPLRTAEDLPRAFEAFLEHLRAHEFPHLRDSHVIPQTQWLALSHMHYDHLFQMEQAQQAVQILGAHIGPAFRDPLQGERANPSLLPYEPAMFTARSAELTREMYADDFSRLNYSTELPRASRALTKEALEMAINAVGLLRAKNASMQRMRPFVDSAKQHAMQMAGQAPAAIAQPVVTGAASAGVPASRQWSIGATSVGAAGYGIRPRFDRK